MLSISTIWRENCWWRAELHGCQRESQTSRVPLRVAPLVKLSTRYLNSKPNHEGTNLDCVHHNDSNRPIQCPKWTQQREPLWYTWRPASRSETSHGWKLIRVRLIWEQNSMEAQSDHCHSSCLCLIPWILCFWEITAFLLSPAKEYVLIVAMQDCFYRAEP